MAKYFCPKCGEHAISKCATSRNVFPDNERATLLSNVFGHIKRIEDKPYSDKLSMDVQLYANQQMVGESDAAFMAKFLVGLAEFGEKTIEIALCSHRWELLNDECDLGCCKK